MAPEQPHLPNAKHPDPAPREAERELWQSRYSSKAAIHVWLAALLFLGLAIYLAFKHLEGGTMRVIVLVIAFVPLALVAWSVVLTKASTHYRLTSQRLFVTKGILSRTISEVELVRIDDVAVRHNLVQRVYGVGDVLLTTTDKADSEIEIHGIDNPVAVKEMIRENVQKLRARVLRMESV